MPVRSVIYKEERLVVTVEEGRVTFDDMQANQDRLLNDPDFDPEFNQLSDATLATDSDLSEHNLRTLYSRKVFSDTSRRAVVATSDFAFGMARMLRTRQRDAFFLYLGSSFCKLAHRWAVGLGTDKTGRTSIHARGSIYRTYAGGVLVP